MDVDATALSPQPPAGNGCAWLQWSMEKMSVHQTPQHPFAVALGKSAFMHLMHLFDPLS
jgi:hypothetical protein